VYFVSSISMRISMAITVINESEQARIQIQVIQKPSTVVWTNTVECIAQVGILMVFILFGFSNSSITTIDLDWCCFIITYFISLHIHFLYMLVFYFALNEHDFIFWQWHKFIVWSFTYEQTWFETQHITKCHTIYSITKTDFWL